jgi:RHS repeat-associated protein
MSGVPNGWRWRNGTQHSRSFDLDGRQTSVTLGPNTRSIGYEAVGRVSGFTDTGPGIYAASSFTYDEADQLSGYSGPQGTAGYGWDTNGNRRSEVAGGFTRPYTYEANSNRLQSVLGVRGFRYNADGNPLAEDRTGFQFTYDAFQRLVQSYRSEGVNVAEAYDGLGMRVYKGVATYTACGPGGGDIPYITAGGQRAGAGNATIGSGSKNGRPALTVKGRVAPPQQNLENPSCWESSSDTVYFHDDQGRLLGEYDFSGNRIQETLGFAGMPVATVQRNGAVYHVHSDHLGTPRSVTRASDGLQVWRWDSEPFGSTPAWVHPSFQGAPLLFTFNLRFPGQYFDPETGFHYNWMRHYDPRTGRYLEADPLGLGGGLARYTYVAGSPINTTDPAGLAGIENAVGAVVGGIWNATVNGMNFSAQGRSFWEGAAYGFIGGAVGGFILPSAPVSGGALIGGITNYLNAEVGGVRGFSTTTADVVFGAATGAATGFLAMAGGGLVSAQYSSKAWGAFYGSLTSSSYATTINNWQAAQACVRP